MISLVIFPVAAALAVLLKRRFEETVFPAIGLLTVSMLLAVAIGKTALAPYFSVVYLVAAIVLLIVFRAGIKKYVLTPGFAAFCVYYAFFILFSFGRFFNTDAALSQYAPSVYHLFNKQTLLDDCLFYDLNNPFPFGTLWALFCNGKGERLQEWLCIFASDILIVSGFLPLFTQIESIKKETWQWIAMLFAVLFFPLLKYTGAYSSFDMVYPQTAVMAYTYILFYHIVCEKQKKGDILLAAFGLFWSCTLSGYGIYTVVPLLIGISAVIILQPKRHIKLIPIVAVAFVATLLCSLFSYSLGSTEGVDWKTVSGVYLGCLLTGGIISAAMLLYRKGYQKVSLMVILALLAVSTGVMVLSLQHGVNRENAVERFLGYTGRLFEGNNEHTIGKNFLPFSDMVFLFALWGLSGMIDIRLKKQSKKATDRVKTFRISYELGIVIYFMVLCVLYVNEIWMVNADKAPSVLPYVAPCIILSAVGRGFLHGKKMLPWLSARSS